MKKALQSLVWLSILLLMASPVDSKQKKTVNKIKLGNDIATVVFPSSHPTPTLDSNEIDTEFGPASFSAYISNGKKSALMAGLQKYNPDALTKVDDGYLLDSTAARTVRNMHGKIYKQYRIKKKGLLTRTVYFSAEASDKTPTFWRVEFIVSRPYLFQIAATSSDKSFIGSKTAGNFFSSLDIARVSKQ